MDLFFKTMIGGLIGVAVVGFIDGFLSAALGKPINDGRSMGFTLGIIIVMLNEIDKLKKSMKQGIKGD